MKITRAAVWTLLITVLTCAASLPASAQSSPGEKVERALKSTGLVYKTYNPTTWSVDMERKNLKNIKVIISTDADVVVTFATLAKDAEMRKSQEMMQILLHANYEYDLVKIGFDNDSDLFVRIDTPWRLVDTDALKGAINQVASASDEVYASVSRFINK